MRVPGRRVAINAPTEYIMHRPTDRCAEQFMHVGFLKDGALVGSYNSRFLQPGIPIVLMQPSAERMYRIGNFLGRAFEKLPPGSRPPDLIVGKLADGRPITVAAVEMVYNDAALVNTIAGSAMYEKVMAQRPEVEVLEEAKRLYKEPVIVGACA